MKNKILKGITWIATVILLFSVMLLDLKSIIPTVTALLSLTWIGLFVLVNREYMERNYG